MLVVTHGGFGNSLLRELLGIHHGWFAFSDTASATLRLSRAGHDVVLTGVNLAPHLPPRPRAGSVHFGHDHQRAPDGIRRFASAAVESR